MVLLGDEAQVDLVSVHLEIVLFLTQDRCTVCAECTIGSEIILDAPDGTPSDIGHVESRSVHLEMVLELVQDRRTSCAKCIIGSYIV